MLPPALPNPNLLSPFPLPLIEDIRPYLWSQHLLTSLSVNQTRGQLVHCPYYKPFSSLDSGAPSPPFLATANHYFEWRSIYTNHTLAVATFIVHPAYSQEKPQVLFDKHPVFFCESCIISWWDFPTALPGEVVAWLQEQADIYPQEESFWLFSYALADFVDRFWKPVFPYDYNSPNLRPNHAPRLPLTPNHPSITTPLVPSEQ